MSDSTRTVVMVVTIVILLPLLWGSIMMGGMVMGPWMMGGWGGAVGPWGGVFVPIVWLLIMAGIGLVAAWGFRQMSGGELGSLRQPLDILKERYAQGELTREQFEQMRRDLA